MNAIPGRLRRRDAGLTLIEIMMVVVIIGILAAVLVPNIMGSSDEARIAAQKIQLRTIGNALDLYRAHNGRYPSTDQGLDALVNPKPYINKSPLDQWDNELIYINQGASFELVSLGADGADGGDGVNADIRHSAL